MKSSLYGALTHLKPHRELIRRELSSEMLPFAFPIYSHLMFHDVSVNERSDQVNSNIIESVLI